MDDEWALLVGEAMTCNVLSVHSLGPSGQGEDKVTRGRIRVTLGTKLLLSHH
jgi:hypothetical protein